MKICMAHAFLFLFSISTFTNEQKPNICQDLYKNICKSRDKGVDKISLRLKQKVERARTKALKNLGIKNDREFIKQIYQKKGLTLDKYNIKLLRYLKNDQGYISDSDFFPSAPKCRKKVEAISKNIKKENSDELNLKFLSKIHKQFIKTKKKNYSYLLKNPKLLQSVLGKYKTECRESIKEYHLPKNKEKSPFCHQLASIKNEILDQIKKQSLSQSLRLKLEEIFDYIYRGDIRDINKLSRKELKNKESLYTYSPYKYTIKNLCSIGIKDIGLPAYLKKEAQEYLAKVSRSKAVVEEVLNEIYDAQTIKKMNSDFLRLKENINIIISKWNIPEKKKRDLKVSFDGLHLNWPSPPSNDLYSLDQETGLMILDEDKLNNGDMINFFSFFFDPSLNFAYQFNAFYITDFHMGKKHTKRQVNMLPFFVEHYKEIPESALFVMAHEAAHNMDYNNSFHNGFSLREFFKPLTSCYASKESFSMHYNSIGETTADYMASEVIAQMMGDNIKDNKRYLKASMNSFCYLNEEIANTNFSLERTHPDTYYRIQAIVGSNPSIRKKINCEEAQTHYRNCGL